ncbi:MFS multidrug transporter [Calycina marina]|uniref:MFS multidrug transporter n=1 Tax=Calycina marina TaxID=1763456 RepID=A0A9P7ZBF6_9HELO|nr:MFS multidrug transporter [Calycina marina]
MDTTLEEKGWAADERELYSTRMQLNKGSQATSTSGKEKSSSEELVEYPGFLMLILISIALVLAVFLTALDNMIIVTAIPKITTQFNSLDDIGWYGAAFLITTGGFQLIFGKLYVLYPVKWVFLTSIAIFEIGSLLCGAAPNSTALILGRAIAGLGSAGLFNGAMVIISYSVRLEHRPVYFGIFGGVYAVASVVGPLLGGVFTDKVSWRWCFYINLPIGAVTVLVIFFILEHPKQKDMSSLTWKERVKQSDIPGNALFMLLVVCLLLAVQWGGIKYPWKNGRIIALFVLAGLFIIFFIFLQLRLQEKATLPPRIAKMRTIWSSIGFSFFLVGAMFYVVFYLPIWFQAVQGTSAIQSGIRSLPLILSMTFSSIVSGAVIGIIGYYVPFMIGGCAVLAVGTGLLTMLEPNSSKGVWIGYQILVGLGTGAANQQAVLAVQTVLEQKDIPIGTALVIFAQTLGGAIAIAIGQSIFRQELTKNIIKFAPDLDPIFVIGVGASHIQDLFDKKHVPSIRQAYNDAITAAMFVAIAFACIAIVFACLVEWKSVKPPVKKTTEDTEARSATEKGPDNDKQLPLSDVSQVLDSRN